ncbi:unnamed protein product [Nippostrongylus brasiliensis]|uniref:Tick transposon n=1 Tax=Nippostrongylus brasiliensis TaxID=27835 RepID=A0A0N4Y829_NIPBR|nr:unnamed protein product [Nippostrongylus brasiliensis]
MFVLVHSLYYEWPTREFNKLRPEATAEHQSWRRSSSSPLFARERRANNLCGKRFIEHLLILCNSCILPAGSEIIKRVAHERKLSPFILPKTTPFIFEPVEVSIGMTSLPPLTKDSFQKILDNG